MRKLLLVAPLALLLAGCAASGQIQPIAKEIACAICAGIPASEVRQVRVERAPRAVTVRVQR